MSTIPDDLRQVIRELEKIQEAMEVYNLEPSPANYSKLLDTLIAFAKNPLEDAIAIVSDAEERLVMLEARSNE